MKCPAVPCVVFVSFSALLPGMVRQQGENGWNSTHTSSPGGTDSEVTETVMTMRMKMAFV